MKTVPRYLFLICDTTLAILSLKISMIQAWGNYALEVLLLILAVSIFLGGFFVIL
jgi:hypothetical protein